MSVMDYFGQTYGLKLKYPNGPILELRGHNKPKVPAEVSLKLTRYTRLFSVFLIFISQL